jgi:DNA-binding transcriptional ArsR family regulator
MIMSFLNNPCHIMQDLSEQALAQVAQYFSALAEPTRLRILNHLREQELNVGDLASLCDCSQANVSRHLSNLAKHGLVARESRGTAVYYRIADPAIYELCDLVCGNVAKQLEAQASLLSDMTNIKASRSKQKK